MPHELQNDLRLLIRKFSENIPTGWRNILVSNLPSRNKNLTLAVKNCTAEDIKLFWSCPIFLNFFILFQVFCPRLLIYIQQRRFLSSSLCFHVAIFFANFLRFSLVLTRQFHRLILNKLLTTVSFLLLIKLPRVIHSFIKSLWKCCK